MKEALTTAVMTSISEVMETMFFLPVEYVQDATLAQCGMGSGKNLACRLSFSGDISGHLILIGNESLVEEMAQNFMGESLDQITDQHLAETFKEMLNMVCGNALSKIESSVPFELGIPETLADSDIPHDEVCSIVETTQSKMAFCLKTD